jgi:hypothetical protein
VQEAESLQVPLFEQTLPFESMGQHFSQFAPEQLGMQVHVGGASFGDGVQAPLLLQVIAPVQLY